MVDFRRCITALAVLALFAGLAVAQTGNTNAPLQCATNVTVTPLLRGEGFTEQTGDVTLTCTGGTPPAVGAAIPQVNITVFYNTQVTSRLLPITASSSVSEALLMIDEPGSGQTPVVSGFGPAATQTVCPTPTFGCVEVVGTQPAVVGGVATPVALNTVGAITPGFNVFQGIVTGNSVTFFGIPVLAPGTTNSRVYRITNVRVNANPLAGGSASGASPVQASISISGATSLLISNATPFVGFVSNGLTASVSGTQGDTQCTTQTRSSVTTLRFAENFGTAFKTRVAATLAAGSGQISNPVQNVPGGIYNSESNFVLGVPGSTTQAGLADFGTRLKAVFNNIPAGARIFVSTSNVLNNNFPVVVPTNVGGSAANSGSGTNVGVGSAYVGYAQLVTNESTTDSVLGGIPLAPSQTDNAPQNGNVPVTEVTLTGGSGQAVWEVVNTNPNTIETFSFGVYITYSANVPANSPAPGTSTVNLSFAPSPPSFKASDGAAASSSLTIPRFIADSGTARNILTITVCRTILLYPYVLNQIGLDTGLAVANTSQDPFTTGGNTTGAQSGTCRFTFFGGTTTAPTTAPPFFDTPTPIAGGTVYGNTISSMAPNFTGYVIAVCNFQWAHGFAFISDIGIRNISMGYLAVVLDDPGTNGRRQGNTVSTENGGH